MKIEGQITILASKEGVKIELRDKNATIQFATITLTPEMFTGAVGRSGRSECEIELSGLDKVGKVHENRSFEFEIPSDVRWVSKEAGRNGMVNQKALRALEDNGLAAEGWEPDNYYGSQDSFFTENGKHFARCVIRRWI
jgi:hypothetical protein